MIFKCGLNKLYCFVCIILAELVSIKTEIKVYIIQKIANDFNGFSNLFSQIVCNFLNSSVSLVLSNGLV